MTARALLVTLLVILGVAQAAAYPRRHLVPFRPPTLPPMRGANPCPCRAQFVEFVERFERPAYAPGEFFDRCHIFCDNLRAVEAHNAHPNSTYRAAIKPLHDLTADERRRVLGFGYKAGGRDKTRDAVGTWAEAAGPYANGSLPPTRDWIWQSRVTDVRDQGQCGSCWSESATAVLESWYAQKTGNLTQLSVQQVAECSANEYDMGCEGGWPIDGLKLAKAQGGLCTEAAYPYVIGDGMDRDCNRTLVPQCRQRFAVDKILTVPPGNVTMLQAAAAVDVVSVAIDASGQGFYAYDSGVYDGTYKGHVDCEGAVLDHAVVVVGYGVANNVSFFAVRNSWGVQGWGKLNGYVLMKLGNTCGIAEDAVYLR